MPAAVVKVARSPSSPTLRPKARAKWVFPSPGGPRRAQQASRIRLKLPPLTASGQHNGARRLAPSGDRTEFSRS